MAGGRNPQKETHLNQPWCFGVGAVGFRKGIYIYYTYGMHRIRSKRDDGL